jgi:D-alanine-D-alanine ligase
MSRVAVLKGGRSLERQVSLRSGAHVEDALERAGHEVIGIDVGQDFLVRLREAAPDVAFIALHGPGGEDGTIQELLEALGVPYTGSGVAASMRCADKMLAKHTLRDGGLPTPDWVTFSDSSFRELGAGEVLDAIDGRLEFPLVIKPNSQGSAIGIRLASTPDAVPAAILAAFSYDPKVLIECFVAGRELAISVITRPDGSAEALPIVEVIPRGRDFYDFTARYDIGRTDFACPAELPSQVAGRVRAVAVAAYEALGCDGFARVDMILSPEHGPQILELNTIPGLLDTSTLPQAAEAAGIEFDELVGRALDLALARAAIRV